MSDQIVPLDTAPNQTMRVILQVDSTQLTLNYFLYYNEMAECWVVDIYDINGNLVLASTPLLTGIYPAANLLCQQGYMAIGSAYILNMNNEPIRDQDMPDNTNLGSGFLLLWSDTAL